MALLPSALERAIEELGHLPGVGPRTAERYAYFLLKTDARTTESLARTLQQLHKGVKNCPKTFALIDADEAISPLYTRYYRTRAHWTISRHLSRPRRHNLANRWYRARATAHTRIIEAVI